MSTTFFYHALASMQRTVEFDSSEATHIHKALRLRSGDIIEVTNGRGDLFNAELMVDRHKVSATPVQQMPTTDLPVALHIGIAPTKNADRIEWLVEKAIELGVGEISLLQCQHSERSRYSIERLQRVAVSALKQSRRTFLPVIHELIDFEQWIPRIDTNQRFIAHCFEQMPRTLLRDALTSESSVCIAIGPEGDFSELEISHAIQASFRSVSLGTARLRTETAALAAVHTFNLQNQTSLP